MIYLELHSGWAESNNYPEFIMTTQLATQSRLRQVAERIFKFEVGKTVYYKDRYGDNFQFTDEEKVVIKLRSVLL